MCYSYNIKKINDAYLNLLGESDYRKLEDLGFDFIHGYFIGHEPTSRSKKSYDYMMTHRFEKINRLTIVGMDNDMVAADLCKKKHPLNQKAARYLLRCECGNYLHATPRDVLDEKVKSCGCYNTETTRALGKKAKTHGLSKTRLYSKYIQMHLRCESKTNHSYPYYGARGIRVCEEWSGKDGFMNFYKWAIEHGWHPQPKGTAAGDYLSIERNNVNGNYCPENCTIIPMHDQCRNRTISLRCTIDGENKQWKEWAKIMPISDGTIHKRLDRGWVEDDAIRIPDHNPKNGKLYHESDLDGDRNPDGTIRWNGPRYDKHGVLRDLDGFMVLKCKRPVPTCKEDYEKMIKEDRKND